MNLQKLSNLIKTFPQKPGVYLMKDADERIIYIGKAVNLQRRVRSYIQNFSRLPDRLKQLVSNIDNIEFISTNNELEALILENNLIKTNQPFYNINLKDSKTYPYIKITSEDFPAVSIVRDISKPGALYFGPYNEVKKIRKALDFLLKLYPIRTCHIKINQDKPIRPCIYYDVGRCTAPCANEISKSEYKKRVSGFINFLRGHGRKKIKELQKKMRELSNSMQYEAAAEVRDQIKGLDVLMTKQVVEKTKYRDFDVVGFWKDDANNYFFTILLIRNRAIRLTKNEALFNSIESESDTVLSFIKNYYLNSTDIPSLIYTAMFDEISEELNLLSEWLSQKTQNKITFSGSRPGVKKILAMAENTARLRAGFADKLIALKRIFGLMRVPKRIEGYDISNYGSDFAVGSMTEFKDAQRDSSGFRRFRIKFNAGIDDYGMMREVLVRRFSPEHSARKTLPLPDMLLIDGGKAHWNIAKSVVEEFKLKIDVLSIAKKEERIFSAKHPDGLLLDKNNPALLFLMFVRDETHKYGINYNRNLRKMYIASNLTQIDGIGEKRAKKILRSFPDISDLKKQSASALAAAAGIPLEAAEKVLFFLRGEE